MLVWGLLRRQGRIRVKSLLSDSPAMISGLVQPGDVVLQAGGQEIVGMQMPQFALVLRVRLCFLLHRNLYPLVVPADHPLAFAR